MKLTDEQWFDQFKSNQKNFWEKIEKTDECWLWIASRNLKGYGYFNLWNNPNRKKFLSHRLTFMLENGFVDRTNLILHSCDTPNCVNPAHLRIGTYLDNTNDARIRGRLTVGTRNGMVKLTQDDVDFIRSSTLRGCDLANQFSVGRAQISRIRNGTRWKFVE